MAVAAAPYAVTVAFLMDLSGRTTVIRRLIPVRPYEVTVVDAQIPTRHGLLEARLYRPGTMPAPVLVVFPGVHGYGADEPRLVHLCGQLAATGHRVLCAPLPAMREFRITSTSVDQMEDVAHWAASSADLAPRGRVGLVGVSFSGALALVAAGRPSLSGKVTAVISLGGYGSLPRTLEYFATGRLPDGTVRRPHDYALAVVALDAVDHLAPEPQRHELAKGIRRYLQASLDQSTSEAHNRVPVDGDTDELPVPARDVLAEITGRDVDAVGHRLAPIIALLGRDPALSPELSPATHAPVFLLHGRDDNVIPSSETPLVAEYLERHGNGHVRWLLTPLISHADFDANGHVADLWRFILFWTDVRRTIAR